MKKLKAKNYAPQFSRNMVANSTYVRSIDVDNTRRGNTIGKGMTKGVRVGAKE